MINYVGYLYRVDCSCGVFYVGLSTQLSLRSIEKYFGSGVHWLRHIAVHKTYIQSKIILEYFTNRELLFKEEVALISESKKSSLCLNVKDWEQGKECEECESLTVHKSFCSSFTNFKECLECGAKRGNHRRKCSNLTLSICTECLGKSGNHKKNCSEYVQSFKTCGECFGSMIKHKKTCSSFVQREPCRVCGNRIGHKRFCENFVGVIPEDYCSECDKIGGHKMVCSKWVSKVCSECGSVGALHFKVCADFKERVKCGECSGKANRHFKSCSKYLSGSR